MRRGARSEGEGSRRRSFGEIGNDGGQTHGGKAGANAQGIRVSVRGDDSPLTGRFEMRVLSRGQSGCVRLMRGGRECGSERTRVCATLQSWRAGVRANPVWELVKTKRPEDGTRWGGSGEGWVKTERGNATKGSFARTRTIDSAPAVHYVWPEFQYRYTR
eukprot:5889113-Pleurochrysis_carterae.AAC.2